MGKKTVRDVDVAGKRVLVRVDFNVPIKDGNVTDDTRIRASIPTIEYLRQQGCRIVLMSHLGRPKDAPDPAFQLDPVASRLGQLLSIPVRKLSELSGPGVEAAVNKMQPGDIVLLENSRFDPREKKNDPTLAKNLAALADIYVNDAFGSAHRAHSSTEGVAKYIPAVAGFLMEKEIQYLGAAVENPAKPFVAILGGAKISDKIGVIKNLLTKADTILIGGGMANTFFKAEGYPMADSLVEAEALETATELLKTAGTKLRLPVDVVIADKFDKDAAHKVIPTGAVPDGWRILDIGPETIEHYAKVIKAAKTVVWNGPMGVFEFPEFAKGTFGVAKAVADSGAVSIVGGGDSVAAIQESGLTDKITHISTGGGASLEMLEGITLPGVAALLDK